MIEITGVAQSRIKEILDKNPGKYLRLVVEGDGCAGPYLGLSLDEPEVNEVTVKVGGIDLLISDQARSYIDVANINVFVNPPGPAIL